MNDKKTGFILINKPSGPTSHDIIYKMRKITGIKRIGHAGTLDPFASGLLIVAVGREATREINKFVKLNKKYIATLHLGATTDTYDREGEKSITNYELTITNLEIERALKEFIGRQKQVPPMYSAKKVKGKKLYRLARKGIEIKREAVDIEIKILETLQYSWPVLKIKCQVSSGTYIRSFAYDIGKKLGCGAYLEELERTAIGDYELDEAVGVEKLNSENWENYLF